MTSLPEYLAIPLIQNMFVATAVVCVLCGIIGAYVVVNRMVSVTGGIAHTVFGGVGFAYYVSSVFLVSWLPINVVACLTPPPKWKEIRHVRNIDRPDCEA